MAKGQTVKKSEKSDAPTTEEAVAPALAPLTELRQRMDELFEDIMTGWRLPSLHRDMWSLERPSEALGLPRLRSDLIDVKFEVSDSEDSIDISAELPGVEEKDIDVSMAEGVLTIKGEKKSESEEKKKDYYRSERSYGSFMRSFRLPESVDDSKIKATFENGVLELKLPKRPEAKVKAKKIAVSKK